MIGRSREEFVKHNKAKYGLPLAIWVACEVWDFGTMSTLYNGMRVQEQDEITKRFGLGNGRIFATWLRGLNYLRNVCAHHSRLWNRNVIDQPKLPPAAEVAWVASFEKDARLRALLPAAVPVPTHAARGESEFHVARAREAASACIPEP